MRRTLSLFVLLALGACCHAQESIDRMQRELTATNAPFEAQLQRRIAREHPMTPYALEDAAGDAEGSALVERMTLAMRSSDPPGRAFGDARLIEETDAQGAHVYLVQLEDYGSCGGPRPFEMRYGRDSAGRFVGLRIVYTFVNHTVAACQGCDGDCGGGAQPAPPRARVFSLPVSRIADVLGPIEMPLEVHRLDVRYPDRCPPRP